MPYCVVYAVHCWTRRGMRGALRSYATPELRLLSVLSFHLYPFVRALIPHVTPLAHIDIRLWVLPRRSCDKGAPFPSERATAPAAAALHGHRAPHWYVHCRPPVDTRHVWAPIYICCAFALYSRWFLPSYAMLMYVCNIDAVGDETYGPSSQPEAERLMLHAHKLR